jgi:DNA-binding response OmpR family regulator
MPSPSPDATPPLRAERWLVFGGPRALRETLEAMPNEVRRVKDSAAFVASLHGDHPDVAVLTMPPGTSDDLAALIAARHRRPGLTACLLTSASMVDERLQALASGIDEALPAGVTGMELAARVARLRRRPAPRTRRLGIRISDDVSLDPELHELRRGDGTVHLSPREHALLIALVSNRGRVCSRRELLDRAWGDDRERGLRTVDVHVRWLREKLEVDPAAPRLLRTVRGLGYRLERGPATRTASSGHAQPLTDR